MVLALCPIKALAYASPVFALGWYLLTSGSTRAKQRTLLWVAAWVGCIVVYNLYIPHFDLTSAILEIFTYGSFALPFAVPNNELSSRNLLLRMTQACATALLLESCIGLLQGVAGAIQTGNFDIASGDYVQGTIYPLLHPDLAFANPMFAVNLSFMLLALLPFAATSRRWRRRALLGVAVLVLASVMHVLIFLFLAVTASLFYFRPEGAAKKYLAKGLVFAPLLMGILLTTNLRTLVPIVQEALAQASPRALVVVASVLELPNEHPLMPVVGLGPGQFSSRAALISSGLFLGGPYDPKSLPLLTPSSSQPFQEYIENLWVATTENPYWGSSQKPFFSWLSLYTEWGLPIILVLICLTLLLMVKLRKRTAGTPLGIWATALGAGILFLMLLGLQENYWEIPQAILIGVMWMKAVHATLMPGVGAKRRASVAPVLAPAPQRLGHTTS